MRLFIEKFNLSEIYLFFPFRVVDSEPVLIDFGNSCIGDSFIQWVRFPANHQSIDLVVVRVMNRW